LGKRYTTRCIIVSHASLIYCSTRVLVSQASILFRSCCMLQDLAVGPLHFSGRARMCHRRMRMYLAHRTRTPCRVASRISRACTARSSPCDSQCSVAPSSRVRIGRERLCSSGRGNSDMASRRLLFNLRGCF